MNAKLYPDSFYYTDLARMYARRCGQVLFHLYSDHQQLFNRSRSTLLVLRSVHACMRQQCTNR